ncbi:MAG: restriction endonuclease subunit S, partial [Dolichospermum sp.]
ENGTPYKSSGGKMVYNQELKREIPAGWEVKLLGDIGKNIKNVIKQTDIDPEISYIGLEHIPRKKIALDTWSTAFDLASDKLSFTRRDILFGKLRPYFHKVGVAFISGVCSTDILVLNSKKESYFGLFLMVVSSDNFINYVNLATEGTRMPRTKWEFMKQYLLAVPKEDINQKFNDILKPLISQMENNTYQNQQLTQLRDWLLPMLMNGQITVK